MRVVTGRLASEIRATVPLAPGVYAFTDREGRLLYVGKSVSLRSRMLSYFQRDPSKAEPGLGRLVSAARGFAWWQTPSELLALLLEDALIKEYLPTNNKQLKRMAEARYLELTTDEFPTVLIVEHSEDFGDREVFGPYRDVYFAGELRGILHEALGVRTCSERVPSAKCLDHDIDRCAGPCRGAVSRDDYLKLVAAAREFLRGDARAVRDSLVGARESASDAMRYEEAARLQEAIETCTRFAALESFAGRFAVGDCALEADPCGVEYRFSKGALVSPVEVIVARGSGGHLAEKDDGAFSPESAGKRAVSALRRSPPSDRRAIADRILIVGSWLRHKGGRGISAPRP